MAMVPSGLAHAQKVYWSTSNFNPGVRIQRVDLGGPKPWITEDLVFTDHFEPRGIALDAAASKIYWIDSRRKRVVRADVDGTNIEDVFVFSDNPLLGAIEVAPLAGKVYWARSSSPRKIQRANLDGSEVEDVVDGFSAGTIAVDSLRQKFYWTWAGIRRANLDGSNIEDVVVGLGLPRGLAIDSAGGKIYWADNESGNKKIQRADLDGSNVEVLVLLDDGSLPRDMALDLTGGKMYWLDDNFNRISRADLDGSNVEEIIVMDVEVVTTWSLAIDEPARKLYWSDDYRVMRADLDGLNIEEVVAKVETSPRGIDLDTEHGKLYWADFTAKAIRRSNLNGSDIEEVLLPEFWPAGIALDMTNQRMYWSEFDKFGSAGAIRRADLDGANVEDLVIENFRPGAMALDLQNGKMYWVLSQTWIYRANLDGSSVEFLLFGGGVTQGLALDPVDGKIYWGAFDDFNFWWAIRRANLDGTNIEDIRIGDSTRVLAIDASARKIYRFSKAGSIVFRSNLDDSELEFVASAAGGEPAGIVLDLRMPGDCDQNSLVNLPDHKSFIQCMTGPGGDFAPGCSCADDTGDRAVDLADFAALQAAFAGP